jgi:hypothetical protein
MPTNTKSSKKAPATSVAATTEFTEIFTPVYLNSVAQLAKAQKSTLDLAAQQSSEWIGAYKKAFSFFPVAAPTFFFDMAEQAVQTCVETQKSAIDMAAEQAEALVSIAKQRADAYSSITDTVTSAMKTTVAKAVGAQKKALDFAGAQTKTICEASKKQLPAGPATVAVDAFEQGVNTVIAAQKSILDMTTQPFVAEV